MPRRSPLQCTDACTSLVASFPYVYMYCVVHTRQVTARVGKGSGHLRLTWPVSRGISNLRFLDVKSDFTRYTMVFLAVAAGQASHLAVYEAVYFSCGHSHICDREDI
eukprot:1964251-Pleurochrysis_carterae.AAC.1